MQKEITVERVHVGAHRPQVTITYGAEDLIIDERDAPELWRKLGELANTEPEPAPAAETKP